MTSLSRHLPRRSFRWPALIALIACGLLVGCEKAPDRQHLDNPFDPAGPNGGDALQIRALSSPGQIILTWTQPQGHNINEYIVKRADSREGPYTDLAFVPHTATGAGRYIYNYPGPTQTHWFKVQAITVDGLLSLVSLAEPASVAVGPTVVVGDTVTTLATRYPRLSVTVSVGDTLLVGLDASYAGALRVPVAGPDVPTIFNLDLGPAAATDTFHLHVKAFDELGETLPTVLNLPVNFAPKHYLAMGTPLRLVRRVNDLKIPPTGVVRMRFAPSEADLATAAWVPGDSLYLAYPLSDSANQQQIWGEYEGDFGFNATHFMNVKADLLGSATFSLAVSSSRVVPARNVQTRMSALATEMRLSESPDFAVVPWVAYADSQVFMLSEGEGLKTVYAQFRNDWTQSTIFSDYCTLIAQGPDVKILAPQNSTVVVGGTSLNVRGTSRPGTGATAIDSVRVDFGDGRGFREVIGTDTWQAVWSVPEVTANTVHVLRARVWAKELSVTDVVSVTITAPAP